jgi:hypothetical protein
MAFSFLAALGNRQEQLRKPMGENHSGAKMGPKGHIFAGGGQRTKRKGSRTMASRALSPDSGGWI